VRLDSVGSSAGRKADRAGEEAYRLKLRILESFLGVILPDMI